MRLDPSAVNAKRRAVCLSHMRGEAEQRHDVAQPHPRHAPRAQNGTLQHLRRKLQVGDAAREAQEAGARRRVVHTHLQRGGQRRELGCGAGGVLVLVRGLIVGAEGFWIGFVTCLLL